MSYRDRLRKTIQLPSGATIVIAKLNTFNEPFLTTPRKRNGEAEAEEGNGIRLAKFALCNPANGPLEFEGEKLRIVDKPEAALGEITIGELEQADATAIFNSVLDFSGLSKAGQEARDTFHEGQTAGGATPSAGAIVSLPADRPAAAAAG